MPADAPTADDAPLSADARPFLRVSPGFHDWLAAQDISLALTSDQGGRMLLIGRKPDGFIRTHERRIPQCQGLWTDGHTLRLAAQHSLWRFENDLPAGTTSPTGADRRFVAREGRITGRLDIQDIGMGQVDGAEAPVFVSTLFGCIATVSTSASFRPLWKPPFLSALVPEDRCHLSGMVLHRGQPLFVTAASQSDVAGGWREHRRQGGVLIHVPSGETAADGLSLPRSPRLHDGRLWLLNAGRGELATVDPADGSVTTVCFCPGDARGLAFVGRYAVIGLSRPRRTRSFGSLDVEARMISGSIAPRCGLVVVDLDSGQPVHELRLQHTINEIHDVAILPGVREPEAVGFVAEDIQRVVLPES